MRIKYLLALSLALLSTATPVANAHPGHPGTPEPPQPPAQPQYGNGWAARAPMANGPRQEHGVAALNGEVYVVGGVRRNPSGTGVTTFADVEAYRPSLDRWRRIAPLPVAMNHPNLAVVGNRLYVLGGLLGGASWQATPRTFRYDAGRDRWTELASMPAGSEQGSAAIGVRGSKIYLAGGMRTLTPGPGGLQDTVATVSTYDTRTGRWGRLPDLPEARDHVGGAVVGNTFYVIGGRDRGQDNVRDTVYAFDFRTRRWTQRAPMPTPRGGIATAVVGGKIYAFGGEGNPAPGSQGVFSESEVYDTARNRWQRLAPMPLPRHGTAAAAIGRTIFIPGGGDRYGAAPLPDLDSYRPTR